MAASSPARTARNGWLDAYIALVALVALGLTIVVGFEQASMVAPGKLIYVYTFCVLLFAGETRGAWFRFGDGGEVSPGWAFAFSIVLLARPSSPLGRWQSAPCSLIYANVNR